MDQAFEDTCDDGVTTQTEQSMLESDFDRNL